jgi:hypothetical protein
LTLPSFTHQRDSNISFANIPLRIAPSQNPLPSPLPSPISSHDRFQTVSAQLTNIGRRQASAIPQVWVKNTLPIVSERLEWAANFLRSYSGTCIFHFLVSGNSESPPHSSMEQCEFGERHLESYRAWRSNIKYYATVCYRCGCPLTKSWEHGRDIGSVCPRVDYQEWVRPMAFIVYHAPELRKAVFNFLGIDPNAFRSSIEYAQWLGARPKGLGAAVNLMDILYAVGMLYGDRRLPDIQAFEASPILIIFFFALNILLGASRRLIDCFPPLFLGLNYTIFSIIG